MQLDETKELSLEIDYPFRKSLAHHARCGMCQNQFCEIEHSEYGPLSNIDCLKGHKIHYPTMVEIHDCEDYEYKPHHIEEIPHGLIKTFMGLIDQRPECESCFHEFHQRCNGLKIFPFEVKDAKCEFYKPKSDLCKYAIPVFQYGGETLNYYCKLNPEKRDKPCNQSWEYHCLDPTSRKNCWEE